MNDNNNTIQKISAVIITFNEERNIGECIESLLPVADEILVVDSFSTDNTEHIASERGAKFIQHKFEGHIQQKNYAVDNAKHDHVLSLDADERLSPQLQLSILEAKKNFSADGYKFNRLNNYCGKWIKHCGWYPDKKLRLWNRKKGQWDGINPHDKVYMDKGSAVSHLKGDLYHYSFRQVEEHIKQINYFSGISALELYKKGKRSGYLKILLKPPFRFFRDYFLKAGFLDGYEGFIISRNNSYATFLKMVKLKELQKKGTSENPG